MRDVMNQLAAYVRAHSIRVALLLFLGAFDYEIGKLLGADVYRVLRARITGRKAGRDG